METAINPAKTTLADSLGVATVPYRGAVLPALFSGVDEEFQAAITGCVVMDQSWRARLRVSGGDAQRWLNGMVTNTAALEDHHGNYSFLLSAQGRLQGDAYIYRQANEFVLETSQDQQEKLLLWLDHYIIMDDVLLGPDIAKTATLAVAGPSAAALLAETGVGVESLGPLVLFETSIAGCAVTVVRDDTGCVPTFSLWHNATDTLALWNALISQGAVPAGCEAEELLRIAGGTPRFGVDLQERDLPQETGQTRALHFSKGCYIGQEIVERIHSRGNVHRGWRGFVLPGQEALRVMAGAAIMSDAKPVGTLTSVATLPLPSGLVHVGLGIVRLQPLEENKLMQADGIPLQPAALPFHKNSN